MLHREIIQQRLERESELDLVQTAPNVTYEILTRKGETLEIDNPQKVPDAGQIEEFREPWALINILVPSENIGALMGIWSDRRGSKLVKKLREESDRHMFEIAIQAAIGSRVIARETIAAMRKNVTAKCYGGDITRKRKLWAKQAAGKKRMKQVGQVEIPQEAFLAVLETDQ